MMYVPCWPVLAPLSLLGRRPARSLPFPFSASRRHAFYVARGGIYHLARALGCADGGTVLMPDYHSGTEVWAVRAAGATVRYYHVGRDLQVDLEELKTLCELRPRALYLIHFLGWPQPVKEVKRLCQERGIPLIEDCALSLLSQLDGRPLGTFGDFAVFCLYKSLPVPNGGLLVQNTNGPSALGGLDLRRCSRTSVVARITELLLMWLRSRSERLGAALMRGKRVAGWTLDRLGIARLPVGDISPEFSTPGYDIGKLDIAMSPWCAALLDRLDYGAIARRRRENFLGLAGRLAGRVALPRRDLQEGVCPLFFPILVPDKAAAARALRARGIEAVEFWNYGHPGVEDHAGPDAAFLRRHLLELPIHQDVGPAQIEFMAEQVLRLNPCA
ncbi:MAG: DegT/DnrJ/EryC1/StrS aminotransferase family protein [Acidobacteria bacterium]|nr:DegT/DnrJ/EryC1/StrS aminotransferase family protein [Acidobacteriota bacterium]